MELSFQSEKIPNLQTFSSPSVDGARIVPLFFSREKHLPIAGNTIFPPDNEYSFAGFQNSPPDKPSSSVSSSVDSARIVPMPFSLHLPIARNKCSSPDSRYPSAGSRMFSPDDLGCLIAESRNFSPEKQGLNAGKDTNNSEDPCPFAENQILLPGKQNFLPDDGYRFHGDQTLAPVDRYQFAGNRIISPDDRCPSGRYQIFSPEDRWVAGNEISQLNERRLAARENVSSQNGKFPVAGDHTLSPEGRYAVAGNASISPERRGPIAENHVLRAIEGLRFIDSVSSGKDPGAAWREVEKRFNRFASTSTNRIPAVSSSDFAECIGMKETQEFAEELLGALRGRKNHINGISKSELHNYWCRITDPSFSSRMKIFFDMCDHNLDGKITEMEIEQVILLSASANKLSISHEEAKGYAELIMEELDYENRGYIELAELETLFKCGMAKDSGSRSQISVISDRDSVHPQRKTTSSIEFLVRAHWRRAWVVCCWLSACVALFAWKFFQYRGRSAFEVMGYCLCTAKGAAETLKLNMALVLLPVCRNTVTWLRQSRRLTSIVPFNDSTNFHKLIAGGIVIGIILHGGTHLACDFPRIACANRSIFRRTIAGNFDYHQPSYIEILVTTEVITGILMVVLMGFVFLLATRVPRRKPAILPWPFRRITGFNAFWYSHHLFILVYVLLIVHSMFLFLTKDTTEKTTWMYIAIPVIIYAGERVVRAIRSECSNVKVLKAAVYPGKVLSLTLTKPTGFRYRSGMYVFIQCPQVSQFEWHPFSLTSAPDDGHLSLHIRTLGDWSYQIFSLFQEAIVAGNYNFPAIYIDGPYGTASQDQANYNVVVLIGLGIGATPFISIVRDIVHKLHKSCSSPIDGGESGVIKIPSKAYFYWVTREQSSFDWFKDIMKEISETNRKKAVIEMHNYLTSAHKEGDARSALISTIQALHHAKNGVDMISRTPVWTHFSRPNWSRVLSGLADKHSGVRIGVFYCGPQILARELESLCNKVSTKSTRFVFHKENY